MALPQNPVAPHAVAATNYVDSIDPATGEVNKRFEATDPSLVPTILERARRAHEQWSTQLLRERCALLQRLRDVVFDSREHIAEVITRETGKPRVEAIFSEILLAIDAVDFFARRAPGWLRPQRVPHHNVALKAKSGWLEYEPFGVIAIIAPWNYPFSIPLAQIIPALVAGNAVLLKPSELTPWTGALVGELIDRAGFPHNLVQVLPGSGEVGAAIIEAGPDKVVFTGSVSTGRRIAEHCGRKLIPSVLELGGKDAMIVLVDAELDIASSAAVWGSFTNCGQACLCVKRIYVEQAVADRFTELCVQKAKKLLVGPASDPDAEVGPMIRLHQLERVEAQLQDAIARGATILTGGCRRPDLGPNFLEPAVVTQVNHSMALMREETFGPILAIQAVASAERSLVARQRFALCARRQHLDRRHPPRQGTCLAFAGRFRDDQRRCELLRHRRGPSRRTRRQRLGTHALPFRPARNGSSKIRRRGPFAARGQVVVVWLLGRIHSRRGPVR